MLDRNEDMMLIDCRRPDEFAICQISGAQLIPMRQISERTDELAGFKTKPVIVYCHHGIRSLRVVNWLRDNGFELAQSMSGGIDAWSQEIDPTVARY